MTSPEVVEDLDPLGDRTVWVGMRGEPLVRAFSFDRREEALDDGLGESRSIAGAEFGVAALRMDRANRRGKSLLGCEASRPG